MKGVQSISMLGLVVGCIYTVCILGLAVWGTQSLVLAALFLLNRRSAPSSLAPEQLNPAVWPAVTVQIPIYNERHVVERIVSAAGALDYPADKLTLQVLDDSTDETAGLALTLVERYRKKGVNIVRLGRKQRHGFKAGALAEGLAATHSDFIAVFDADFLPPSDFLKRLIPYFDAYPDAGVVQARWGHLNAGYNALTRAQALALDGHFVVEQTARARSGLPLNFNGSGGIWRRQCIEAAGGWQSDTLAEDLDLSYRAQLAGWRVQYVPEVIAPAEIPPQMAAYRRQQFRWACGSVQVLRKLLVRWWTSPLPLVQRVSGVLHVGAYLAYPLMLVALLVSLPLAITGTALPGVLGLASIAGFGPPLVYALSQWAAYADWPKRLAVFPVFLCTGMGLMLNNTWAVLNAFWGRPAFARTPKFHVESRADGWRASDYALKLDWIVWGELALAAYAGVALVLAVSRLPGLVPFLALMAASLGYVSLAEVWQARPRRARPKIVRPVPLARAETVQKFF
jgi:cellulose synthase/poly-beta-1,6-N-acetylglucosamine synthase-like glycosyltransferase